MTAIRGRLAGDAAWNYGAFVVMAVVGAAVNLFIAGTRGAEALGVFNQAYAVFVVSGQLATLALHDSVQKHLAEYIDDVEKHGTISRAAIWCTMASGAIVAGALYLSAPAIGRVTDSESVGTAVGAISFGVFLFAVNKTLMGVLNGTRRMRAFALAQATRLIVILTSVVTVGMFDTPHWMLALSFTVAEAVLLPALLLSTRRHWTAPRLESDREWMGQHLRFGAKALPNAFLAESLFRVDILMLGLFVTDESVGYYSFAAIFLEGLYQLPVVIRTVANPVLVRLCAREPRAALAAFSKRLGGLSLAVFVPISLIVYFAFPLLGLVVDPDMVARSRALLLVLLGGLAVYSAFIPVDHVLLQAGMPGRQSALMATNVTMNVLLNAVLIPEYGVTGAAIATALTYLASPVFLILAARMWLGMPLGLFLASPEPGMRGRLL